MVSTLIREQETLRSSGLGPGPLPWVQSPLVARYGEPRLQKTLEPGGSQVSKQWGPFVSLIFILNIINVQC